MDSTRFLTYLAFSRRFKQFDRVAGPVFENGLFATLSCDDFISESSPGLTQTFAFADEVLNPQLNPISAAWFGKPAVTHCLSGTARTGRV